MKVRYNAATTVPVQLRPYLVGESPREDGEWDMYCPLHEDTTRSAQLNIDEGVWYCHAGCGGGTIKDLLEEEADWVPRSAVATANVSPSRRKSSERVTDAFVYECSRRLLDSGDRLDEFQDLRGLWTKTIADFQVGWDPNRRAYTIPVRNEYGELVNIRRYQPHPPAGRRKMWSVAGHGAPMLYPFSALTEDKPEEIIICEGELDALITTQYGYPAITRTASAITWKRAWNRWFRDRVVYICHDCDTAGQQANQIVADSLAGIAREIRIIKLPYPIEEKHGKDLTDWWMEHEGEHQSLRGLMKGAQQGKVIKIRRNGRPPVISGKSWEINENDVGFYGQTDIGNSRRFIRDHYGSLIYTQHGWYRWAKYHFTDAERSVWRLIEHKETISKYAKATLFGLAKEAEQIKDKDERKSAVAWARSSRTDARIRAMVRLAAAGDPEIPDLTVSVRELNKNKLVLNTPSGIIDLESGELGPHDPTEYCTHSTSAPYDPNADVSEWEHFLKRIMPDGAMREFLQIALGASITGYKAKAVNFLYGPDGDNGKTAIVEAVRRVLGDYSGVAKEGTLMNATADKADYDLATLVGARFVAFAEMREGHGLASERIKRITGGDTIKTRAIYGEPFEFQPEFSLWLATNNAPVIPSSDTATWNRVNIFPMFEIITEDERIDSIWEKLDPAGVLRWMVIGAQAFIMNGCSMPRSPIRMEEQKSEWRKRDDIIKRWLEAQTTPVPDGRVSFKDLWQDFQLWCDQEGERASLAAYTSQKFHGEMDLHPYERGPAQKGYPTRLGLVLNTQVNRIITT